MSTSAITTQDLCVSLSGKNLIDHFSVELKRGTVVSLVGPNGSGKTTLLKALAGFYPYQGKIEVVGLDPSTALPKLRAQTIGYLSFEELPYFGLKAREMVALGRICHGETALSPNIKKIDEAMKRARCIDFKFRDFHSLSSGEKSRVLLARVFAQDPSVLLLDEILSKIDLGVQLELLSELKILAHDLGKTVVMVSHDLNLAAQVSDEMIVLAHGKTVAMGRTQAVFTNEVLSKAFQGVRWVPSVIPGTSVPHFSPVLKSRTDLQNP